MLTNPGRPFSSRGILPHRNCRFILPARCGKNGFMFLLRKYQSIVGSILGSESPRAYLAAALALVLCIGGSALFLWIVGAPPMNGRPADCPVLLDGAWRVLNGQVP